MLSRGRPAWYRPDYGLAARMLLTLFLVGLVYILFAAVLRYVLGAPWILLAVIALAIAGVQLFLADKIALASMRARIVDEREAPDLHEMVGRLAAQADLPKPHVAIMSSGIPNAFATGRGQHHAVIAVTTALQQRLTTPEQEQKFVDLEQRLSARVEAFRAQKEMTKAQYGAARAQVSIQEAAAGISEEMTDVNLAMQRAQEKVQQVQARACAMDDLIASGSVPELGPGTPDAIDRELATITSRAQVDEDLAALKAPMQLPAGGRPPQQLAPAEEQAQPSR